jgi:hypothetical protein
VQHCFSAVFSTLSFYHQYTPYVANISCLILQHFLPRSIPFNLDLLCFIFICIYAKLLVNIIFVAIFTHWCA